MSRVTEAGAQEQQEKKPRGAEWISITAPI